MENASSSRKTIWTALAIVILAVAVSGAVAVGLYRPWTTNVSGGSSNRTSPVAQQVTMAQAVQSFKNYLTTLHNSNIAVHEVEEYQYNFYASYYEKDTGIFAFQMLIWKSGSGYVMGTMGYTGATGVPVPEIGPNMMWNTKYSVMSGMMSGGMMGGGMMEGRSQGTSTQIVSASQARTLAQQYLNNSLPGKMAGDADTYYGYYNIDVLLNGSTFGMLSVNSYTGQVWYHSWHGAYIQTVTVS